MPAANRGSIGPPICRRNIRDNVAKIIAVGEPLIIESGSKSVETPLKEWMPAGLSDKFDSGFFYAGDATLFGKSMLYRKAFIGNQAEKIDDHCIRLPIITYEEKAASGSGVTNVDTMGGMKKDCIGFVPWAATLDIRLDWDSKDDLDLIITEPDGSVLNKNNLNSPNSCGKLQKDKKTEQCFARGPSSGREISFYRPCEPPTGTFTIKAKHFENCGNGPTNWWLIVKRDGEVIHTSNGSSNLDFSQQIFSKSVLVE